MRSREPYLSIKKGATIMTTNITTAQETSQKVQSELLAAFADGLDQSLFAEACEAGLDVALFAAMLEQRIDSMEEVNTMLERFIASPSTVKIAPDELIASFNRLHREGGFCNC